MMDFVSLLDQHARTQPQRLALRAAGQDWSYAALADASRRAATMLHQQGVRAGDRVALLCLNTPGFVFALFGAWRLGAAVVPINHKLQAPEVDYILGHARIKLCLVDGTLAPLARRTQAAVDWLATDSATGRARRAPRLARYKIPRVFELRDTLPRTTTGKLLKHTLRTAAPTSP